MSEQFSEPEPNVVTSTAGFTVRVLGRTGLRYSEGERSVWIDSEVLARPRALVMSKLSIRHWEGPDPQEIGETERDRISANIERAFEARGYEIEVRGPFDWSTVAIRPPNDPRRTRP
jgi:hypothetical protein